MVKGCQCSITFDLDFEDLATLLENSFDQYTADELREMWDKGELADYINENLRIEKVLEIADTDKYDGIHVGSGYLR